MKIGGRITILRSLIFRTAYGDKLGSVVSETGPIGLTAVQSVSWSETHGEKETSISEHWKPVAPSMWLATSQKK